VLPVAVSSSRRVLPHVTSFANDIERVNIQARAEVFNLLDHANFYLPGFNVFSGSAGVISRLISYPGGREMQFGLKVLF
jgi:hypothetical protein